MLQPSPSNDHARGSGITHKHPPGLPTPESRGNREPGRVSTDQIGEALDEIIATRGLLQPYPLYRHIADQAGIHATTVLRYHDGFLKSAPAAVYKVIRELLVRVRSGHALQFESSTGRSRATRPLSPRRRVPSALVRQKLEGTIRSLGLGERQSLFRYLAERVGLHATTVLRYYQGDLETAPAELVAEIDLLRKHIVSGKAALFCRQNLGTQLVLRERTQVIVEGLLRERGVGAGDEADRSFLRQLDRELDLPLGTTREICSDPDLCFVHATVHRAIEEFAHGEEYDPGRTYRLGERLRHHLFGPGSVKEKIHKNKVRVEFTGGKQVILSEAVTEDPYRFQRLCGGGASTERGVVTRVLRG